MFCPTCGNSIPDGSKFCTNCGTPMKMQKPPVQNPQPTYNQAPQQPNYNQQTYGQQPNYNQQTYGQQPNYSQQAYGQQPNYNQSANYGAPAPKKSNKTPLIIALLVVAIAIIAVVVVILISGSKKSDKKEVEEPEVSVEDTQDTDTPELPEVIADDTETTAEDVTDSEENALFESCYNGAIYENNTLTYGPVCFSVPGFSFLAGGEDEDYDYLVSPDENCYIYLDLQYEFMVSYSATNGEDLAASINDIDGFSNSTLVSSKKFMVGEYPAITYTAKVTLDEVGLDEYITEVIIMDQEEATQSVRIYFESFDDTALSLTDQIVNTATANYTPIDFLDTDVFGTGRITVK